MISYAQPINLCIYVKYGLNVNTKEGGKSDGVNRTSINEMKLVSFGGIGFLIHICSKNKYIFKYSSEKRKIEIYPERDKSQNNQPNE